MPEHSYVQAHQIFKLRYPQSKDKLMVLWQQVFSEKRRHYCSNSGDHLYSAIWRTLSYLRWTRFCVRKSSLEGLPLHRHYPFSVYYF